MTPNEPKNAEKMSNFDVVYPVAFDWPLRPSLAFFIFCQILDVRDGHWYKKISILNSITTRKENE